MLDTSSVTMFYIVEPERYQFMACHLLASIRTFLPAEVKAIGYCPEHRMHEVHPAVLRAHELMGAEVRSMKTEGMWREPYPHGNKIIAALQPRETDFSVFLDSDILFINPTAPETFVSADHVSCALATSLNWADQGIWDPIYRSFGIEVPEERVKLSRSKRMSLPYFNAGYIGFPQAEFPKIWYETARVIDGLESVPRKRPYLDQLSLPLAMRRANLGWHELTNEQHYILGGKLRGLPLPTDVTINAVHYRYQEFLEGVGLLPMARKMLKTHTGKSHVRRLVR